MRINCLYIIIHKDNNRIEIVQLHMLVIYEQFIFILLNFTFYKRTMLNSLFIFYIYFLFLIIFPVYINKNYF